MRRIKMWVALAVLSTATTAIAQPINDDCTTGAIEVFVGTDVTQTSALAGAWDTTAATAGVEIPSCAGANGAGVWFFFNAPNDGVFVFDTIGTGDDTGLSIWDACGGTEILCNDDGGGALQSEITLSLLTGETVFLLCYHFGSNAVPVTTGVLNITDTGPPPTAPVNDDCVNAIVVADGTDVTLASTLAGPWTTTGATPGTDGVPSCLSGAAAPASTNRVWFSFIAPADGLWQFDTENSAHPDQTLGLYDACGGNELGCDDDGGATPGFSSLEIIPVNSGDTILISLSGWGGGGPVTGGVLNITNTGPIPTPPANDACVDASALTLGSNLVDFNLAATPEPGVMSSCGPVGEGDVYFTYLATVDGVVVLDPDAPVDSFDVTAYDGCGGTELGCEDFDAPLTVPVTAGDTLTIRLNSGGTAGGTIDVAEFAAADNDACADAATSTVGTLVNGSNSVSNFGSSPSMGVVQSCGPSGEDDVWFQYTATCDGTLSLAINAPTDSFDTQVYTDCAATTTTGDIECATFDGDLTFAVLAGETFIVRLHSGVQTTGTIDIACFGAPTNDTCAMATPVVAGATPVATIGATDEGTTSTCTSGAPNEADVWFIYFAGAMDEIVTIQSQGTGGTLLDFAAYTDCTLTTEVACEATSGTSDAFNLGAGMSLVIRLFGDTGVGDLNITSALPNAQDSCVDAVEAFEGVTAFDSTGTSNDPVSCSAGLTGTWLEFNATADAIYEIAVSNTGGDSADLAVFDSCGGTELACDVDFAGNAVVTVSLNNMDDIKIVVGDAFDNPVGDLTITNVGVPLANDGCAGAVEVFEGVGQAFDTNTATGDPASCAFGTFTGVWYEFNVPADALYEIAISGTAGSSIVAAFDSCGGAELNCDNDFGGLATIVVSANNGDNIKIVVGDDGGSAAGTLTITNVGAPLGNDDCVDAFVVDFGLDVTVLSTTAGPWDTSAATPDVEVPTCGSGATSAGIWYEFTNNAGSDRLVQFDTSNTPVSPNDDTVISIWDGCGGSQIVCDDDGAPTGLLSQTEIVVLDGQTVLIRLSAFGSGIVTGGVLNITDNGPAPVPPVNNDCASASALALGTNAVDFNIATTPSVGVMSSCASTTEADVYFTYMVMSDGTLSIDPDDFDVDTTVYDACGGAELGCATGGAAATLTVVAGQNVTVRLNQFGSNVFNVDVAEFPLPANDTCLTAESLATDGMPVSFTTLGATSSEDATCGDLGQLDVWYEISIAADGTLAVQVDLTTFEDLTVSALDSCGGTEAVCAVDGFTVDSEGFSLPVTAGDSLFVRVGITDPNGAFGEITASVLGDVTGQHVIVDGEGSGLVDSVAAIQAALIDNGIAGGDIVIVPPALAAGLSGTPASFWLQAGTFPEQIDIVDFPGLDVTARDLVLAGVPLYLSGGDVWGFNTPGVLSEVDGIDDAGTIGDGDDSHLGMVGADIMLGFDNLYTQDNAANDWTDQLAVVTMASPDTLGDDAAVIWSDDGTGGVATGYTTGIRYTTTDVPGSGTVPGNVISTSSEFGGYYQGDAMQQSLVMAEYLSFLEIGGGTGQPSFIRGDMDENGSFTLQDPILLLGFFFTGGAAPGCEATADINADGGFGLPDVVQLLQFQFAGGIPPAAPNACGETGDLAGLSCDSPSAFCAP